MAAPNPYQSPQVATEPLPDETFGETGYWRDGKLLVVRQGAYLPDRCVYCNEPSGPLRKNARRSPIWFLRGPVARTRVSFGVCARHRFRQSMGWFLISPLSLVVVFVMFSSIAFAAIDELVNRAVASNVDFEIITDWMIIGSMLNGVLVGVVTWVFLACLFRWTGWPMRVVKIRESQIFLKGAREPFLASLAEGP